LPFGCARPVNLIPGSAHVGGFNGGQSAALAHSIALLLTPVSTFCGADTFNGFGTLWRIDRFMCVLSLSRIFGFDGLFALQGFLTFNHIDIRPG
jgi:hypothetical protein